MNCMKCGRETENEQIFCPLCQTEMEQHPVNPGTVVLLPTQKKTPPKKAPLWKKPVLTPEEQVLQLKKRLVFLRVLVLIMLLLIGGLTFVASRAISELDIQRLLGQNYSTVETVPETTVSSEPTEIPTT